MTFKLHTPQIRENFHFGAAARYIILLTIFQNFALRRKRL
ncbi:hypothetical protein TYRP_022550 [Tyrophagus putrescentiae]|nr:hypothetical protein TYRP_022550 [Tyrophagus putrescentiae]